MGHAKTEARKSAANLATTDAHMTKRLMPTIAAPCATGFIMPAEWAAHARCWMAWPCRMEPWGSAEGLLRARVGYATVARAISGFEKVTMAVRPQDIDEAQLAMGRGIDILEVAARRFLGARHRSDFRRRRQ